MNIKISVICYGILFASCAMVLFVMFSNIQIGSGSLPTPYSYDSLELATNPLEYTWLHYYTAATEYAEKEKINDALFVFLLSKISAQYARRDDENDVDETAVLNTIVASEGGFYSLVTENPHKGIEIVNEARRWHTEYRSLLGPGHALIQFMM